MRDDFLKRILGLREVDELVASLRGGVSPPCHKPCYSKAYSFHVSPSSGVEFSYCVENLSRHLVARDRNAQHRDKTCILYRR